MPANPADPNTRASSNPSRMPMKRSTCSRTISFSLSMNKISRINPNSKNGASLKHPSKLRDLSTIRVKRGNRSLKTKLVTNLASKKNRKRLLWNKTNQIHRARIRTSNYKMKRCRVNKMRSKKRNSPHRDVGSMSSWTRPTVLARLSQMNSPFKSLLKPLT